MKIFKLIICVEKKMRKEKIQNSQRATKYVSTEVLFEEKSARHSKLKFAGWIQSNSTLLYVEFVCVYVSIYTANKRRKARKGSSNPSSQS